MLLKQYTRLILGAIAFFPYLGIAEEIALESKTMNLFQLPSAKSSIIVEGGGYFPILGVVDNRLVTVFRTGGGHLGAGGALSLSWSDLAGDAWSAPQTIVDSTADDRNPAFAILPNQRMVLAYHEQASYSAEGKYDPALAKARCMYMGSDDLGKTWSAPKPLGIEGLESCSPYGRMIRLSNETLMTVYGPFSSKIPGFKNRNTDKGDFAYLVRSTDEGETWSDPTLIKEHHNETALWSLPNGRLLAVGRSDNAMQRLDASLSADQGRAWSSPLRITGPMQHPGDLLMLSNGWILLVFGDREPTEKTIQGVISRDQGRTWDLNCRIVFSRPVFGDFGYPSAALLPNGNLAVVYYSAGAARDSYDDSKAQAIFVQCKESELIEAYQQLAGVEK